jgi:hypothetical protein
MNDDTNQVLTRAYDLIESEHLAEAKALLDPFLEREKDSADAWWLYAHAVQDVDTARKALLNVLRIDPDYPDANDLLKTLEGTLAPAPSPMRPIQRIDASRAPAAAPDLPPTLPEKVDETWEFEEVGEGKQTARRLFTPRLLAVLIPVLFIVVVGGLLLILNSASPPETTGVPTISAEEQALLPTLPVSDFTSVSVDTIVPSSVTAEATSSLDNTPAPANTSGPTPQPTPAPAAGDPYAPLFDALHTFTIPRDGIGVTQTSLGETLLVSICTLPGPELRAALPRAMNAIANVSHSLAEDMDAVGARMLNCGNNSTLLVIGVSLENAVAYADGELSEEQFQALWTSQ